MWMLRQFGCLLLLVLALGPARAQELFAPMREEVLMLRKPALFPVELETTYFRPPGNGPFPLVILNHGKSVGESRMQPRWRPLAVVREWVSRGYAVALPMRQGFSKSGGSYVGGGCNVQSNGLAQAEDVQAVLAALAQRPEIDATRVVLVGQSHGGLTTLAAGSLGLPGVVGLVNFAGGLRQEQCPNWEAALATAFGSYARTTRVPALFFYGDNDSFWSVPVWREMVRQYAESDGRARLVAFGSFGSDAHHLFGPRSGVRVWLPEVERFVRELGLPFDKQREIALIEHDAAVPADTGFAALADTSALPGVRPAAREGYAGFLAAEPPKAFAIGPNGAWAWRSGVADAMKQALQRCASHANGAACRLYAVDDRVVWARD